jgi:hypothetical protein
VTTLKRYVSSDYRHTPDNKDDKQGGTMLGGLTATSREFARVALEYAQANDMSYPDAVRHLMRQTRNYANEIASTTTSPANELASAAKTVQVALKIDFIDAVRSVAREHPDRVRAVADQWLIEQARVKARGLPGLQSENEANALQDVIRSNPDVTAARVSGVLTDSALRKLFPQWIR